MHYANRLRPPKHGYGKCIAPILLKDIDISDLILQFSDIKAIELATVNQTIIDCSPFHSETRITMSTYYDILGVDPTADAKTIRQAYLKLSLKHHPDKNPNDKEAAKAKFCAIGQAYEVLSNPTERSNYDRELRRGWSRPSTQQNEYHQQNQFHQQYSTTATTTSSASYESYQDAFDATVASMSEEELAAAIGAISVVAGIVGSIVGSRLLGGGGSSTSKSTACSSFLSSAGSMVGSMVASHAAAEAARTLHNQAIEKIAYKEEVRRSVARGEPVPPPPAKVNWEETLQRAMGSMMNSATGNSSTSSTMNPDSSSIPQSQRPAWQNKFQTAVDAAKTAAKSAAVKQMAETFRQKAAQEMKKGSR
jgi:curved DNA-binding protein CbpA